MKIVIIGAGSSYTPEFMNGLIVRYDELPVKEIWLVDIEEGREKMEVIKNLAVRMWRRASGCGRSGLSVSGRTVICEDKGRAYPSAPQNARTGDERCGGNL